MTKRGRYGKELPSHWRLTALLRVVHRSETHSEAADWYRQRGLCVPRNCMVPKNDPLPLEHTDRFIHREIKAVTTNPTRIVKLWDDRYKKRMKENSMVLSCEVLFRELGNPPHILEEDWNTWHGDIPATRNPPAITEQLWDQLWNRAQR
jgi:hypothetical protein